MPVGGGTFTVQNKALPGAYYQFRASGNTVSMGARGIAALPLELPWGPENQIYSLAAGDFNQLALKDLGYDPTASELLLVREALKRAKTLLIYRVNSGGAKAAVTVGGLSVTARYGGTRGNALKAAVLANADNSANVDVVTYLDGTEMDRQTVAKSGGAAGLKANDYVTFSTPATLTAAAAASLTGGTNGTVNGSAYTAWMNALEVEDFNVLGYPGTDDSVKSLVTAFVKRLRDDEGKYITGVLYQHTSADSIGIISVKNGVKLSDGTVITGDKAVAWVTGASASAEVNESLTNTTYDDAVDVDIKYTKGQYEAALKAGEFVFYAEKGKARVLSDINSRTTFGSGVSEDWTSNRVIRVLDGWASDTARIFGQQYLGVETNSETGRSLFKADLVSLGKQYEGIDAISNFLPDDVTVQQGNGKRDVAVFCALQPNDSMEKLYMKVTVN